MNGLIERAQNLWLSMERLSGREKIMVLGVVGFVLAFAVSLVVFFVNRNLTVMDSRLETQTGNLNAILEMRSQFKSASVEVDKEQQQIKNNRLNITSAVGSVAGELGVEIKSLTESSVSRDPQRGIATHTVQVSLSRIEMPVLLDLMEKLEKKYELLYVRAFKIRRRYDNKAQVDATVQISTVKALEG